MTDKIFLTGVSGTGYHGVFEQEKREGQTFSVDIEVTSDFSAAVKSLQLLKKAFITDQSGSDDLIFFNK